MREIEENLHRIVRLEDFYVSYDHSETGCISVSEFFYCRVGVIQSLKSLLYDLFAAAMSVAGNPSGGNAEDAAKTPFFTVMEIDDTIKNMGVVAEVRR